MMAQTHIYEEKIIQEVWGDMCIECDSSSTPRVHFYSFQKEDVAVLTCPDCDFTIVVIEIDSLYKPNFQNKINEDENDLIATHPQK